MSVKDHLRRGRPIGNGCRRSLRRNLRVGRYDVGRGINREISISGLEWGIGAGVAKRVAKNAIVENPKRSSYRRLPVALRIPREANARLDVLVVRLVERMACSRSHGGKRHLLARRERSRILKQIGEIRGLLLGHSVELVAQSQIQSKCIP